MVLHIHAAAASCCKAAVHAKDDGHVHDATAVRSHKTEHAAAAVRSAVHVVDDRTAVAVVAAEVAATAAVDSWEACAGLGSARPAVVAVVSLYGGRRRENRASPCSRQS